MSSSQDIIRPLIPRQNEETLCSYPLLFFLLFASLITGLTLFINGLYFLATAKNQRTLNTLFTIGGGLLLMLSVSCIAFQGCFINYYLRLVDFFNPCSQTQDNLPFNLPLDLPPENPEHYSSIFYRANLQNNSPVERWLDDHEKAKRIEGLDPLTVEDADTMQASQATEDNLADVDEATTYVLPDPNSFTRHTL